MWSFVLFGYVRVRTYNPVINSTGRPSGTTKKFVAIFDVFHSDVDYVTPCRSVNSCDCECKLL